MGLLYSVDGRMYFGKVQAPWNSIAHYRKQSVTWLPTHQPRRICHHTLTSKLDSLQSLETYSSHHLPSNFPNGSLLAFARICFCFVFYSLNLFLFPSLWYVSHSFRSLQLLFGFPHRIAMDLSHIINDDKIDLVRHDELERPEYVAETLMSLSTGSNSRYDMTERNEYIPDSQSVTVESSDDEDHSQANFGANMQLLQHLSELNIHLRFMRSRAEREAQMTESVEYVSAAAVSDSISNLRTGIQDLFSQLGNSVNARLQELSNEQQNREEELRSSRKTADDEIENQWKCLSYSIRCLVFMLCQHKLKKYKSLKKSLKTTLEEVSPGIEELYNHEDFQQDVCQAYVWRRIYRGVFESKQCLWKPEAMESLKKAREILLGESFFRIPEIDVG